SSKLNKFIFHKADGMKKGQSVSLLITDKTDIGYVAIVDHKSWGVLFYSEVSKPLHVGQTVPGYIKRIREDGKIDLSLLPPGYAKVEGLSAKVLAEVKKQQGFLPLSDSSSPALIQQKFGVSKRVYKMAIGALFKQKLITIEENGIRITEKGKNVR
ncbi:MAG: GntR family transcriptional regulator, partial [Pseudomonadales bacterium]|nr:GntR family transcriptional regulator [Pseudomonadales bacterium]